MEDTLGYDLINNTVYYYKVTTCDPSSNCGTSACLNLTTKTAAVDKEFIFKMDLPDGFTVDIPALNKTDYNFTETFNISGTPTTFDVGIKTNTSVTKNMNMTIHCGDMAIGLYGINMLKPTKIEMNNAFVCDEDEDMIGMNSTSKKWNKLIDELHLGGASDYVELTLPATYDADNLEGMMLDYEKAIPGLTIGIHAKDRAQKQEQDEKIKLMAQEIELLKRKINHEDDEIHDLDDK